MAFELQNFRYGMHYFFLKIHPHSLCKEQTSHVYFAIFNGGLYQQQLITKPALWCTNTETKNPVHIVLVLTVMWPHEWDISIVDTAFLNHHCLLQSRWHARVTHLQFTSIISFCKPPPSTIRSLGLALTLLNKFRELHLWPISRTHIRNPSLSFGG